MKIDCYLSKGCSAENVLRENIHQALVKEVVNANVNFYRISDSECARFFLKNISS